MRAQFDAELSPLRDQRERQLSVLNGLSVDARLQEINDAKNREIRAAQSRFGSASSAADQERARIRERFETQRRDPEGTLQKLRQDLTNLTASSQLGQASKGRDEELKKLTQEIDGTRKSLLADRTKISSDIALLVSRRQQSLEPLQLRLSEQRDSIIKRSDERRVERTERHALQVGRLINAQQEVSNRQNVLADLRASRVKRRDDISQLAQNDQIYRITALWSGKDSPADITNEELRWVTIVWFGSLAAITAWTGTLLAFGGLVALQGPLPVVRKAGGLLYALRSLLVDSRRRVRRPVIREVEKEVLREVEVTKEIVVEKAVLTEVVREIPVDKVVFRDVPKEIVRKELVYVPFFTDDPELLRQQMNRQAETAE